MSDAQSFSYPSGLSRRNLLQAGSIVLLLGRQHIAHGATIVAVRVWPAPEYTRVTIESDRPLAAKQFFVDQPPRLAVDIEGIDLNPALRELVAKVRSDDPNIASIRVGQNSPSVVRLVIDLKQPAKPQVFTLQPVAAYKHRLVFDLYPAKAVDPLEALISERLRDASGDDTAVAAAPPPPPQEEYMYPPPPQKINNKLYNWENVPPPPPGAPPGTGTGRHSCSAGARQF